MRILDCKSEICSAIAEKSPNILDFLCEECMEHFRLVKRYLDKVEIKYTVNPKIVRGLDYYTKTVFEFVSIYENTKGLVCGGGGRYDGLIEELSGKSVPALGFGLGIGRILLAMEKQSISIPQENLTDVYIVTLGEEAKALALLLAKGLRESSFIAQCDTMDRSLKSQMKYANKLSAKFVLVLGDDEVSTNKAKIKNMQTGEETEINLDERFLKEFYKLFNDLKSRDFLS